MKRHVLRLCVLLLLVLIGTLSYLGLRGWRFLHEAPESNGREVFFDDLPGARLGQLPISSLTQV